MSEMPSMGSGSGGSAWAGMVNQQISQDKQLAANFIGQAADYYNQKHLANQQFNKQIKLMEKGYKLALDQQLMTPLMQLKGMEMAGINPQSIHAGGFSMASAPSGNAAGAHANSTPNITLPGGALQGLATMAQIDALRAQTAKTQAEKQGQDIQNNRDIHADDSYKENLIAQMQENAAMFRSMGMEQEAAAIDDRIQLIENSDVNLGDALGAIKAVDVSKQNLQAFTDKLTSVIDGAIKANQVQDPETVKFWIDKPKIEQDLLKTKLALQLAETYYTYQKAQEAKASANLKGQELVESKKRMEEMDANIRKVGAEIKNLNEHANLMQKQGSLTEAQRNAIVNSDANTAFSDGKIGKGLFIEGVKLLETTAHGVGTGIGYSAGTAVIGAATKGKTVPAHVGNAGNLGHLSKNANQSVKEFSRGGSPFSYGSPSHQVFKSVEARFGKDKAQSLYGEFMQSGAHKKQSFNDWYYQNVTRKDWRNHFKLY